LKLRSGKSKWVLKCNGHAVEQLFEEVLRPTLQHLGEMDLFSPRKGIETALLVGGFGSNTYIKKGIQRFLEERSKIPVLTPDFASLAIVKGAALFGLDEGTFGMRTARATYGINTHNHQDSSRPLFSPIVYRTEQLKEVEDRTRETPLGPYCPVTETQSAVTFQIYETDALEDDPEMPVYTSDSTATFIAAITLPVDRSLPFHDRQYFIKLSLSGPTLIASMQSPDGSWTDLEWETR
jgi:hypothetical protein